MSRQPAWRGGRPARRRIILPADPAWRTLVTLAQTSDDDARSSTTGIACGAGVPPTTALRCIAAMEVQGAVERVLNADDKRQVMIRLTDAGGGWTRSRRSG